MNMLTGKLWLMSHLHDLNEFTRLEAQLMKHLWSTNSDQVIKKTLLMSQVALEKSELNLVQVHSRVHAFCHRVVESFKKHKQLSKNVHYVKEVENTELMHMFRSHKHDKSTESGSFDLILTHHQLFKHYDVEKIFNAGRGAQDFCLFVLLCLMLVCLMCFYILFLFYALYFYKK